jgi:hydrogenase maturation factor HypF (carbamoyltransferase family)
MKFVIDVLDFKGQLETYGEIDADTIVCPHCFYEYEDPWERFFKGHESSVFRCDSCDREFTVVKEVTVTYTTSKKERV